MIQDPTELVRGCAPEYREIKLLIDGYTYYDTPDYAKIYQLLRRALANRGVNEHMVSYKGVSEETNGLIFSPSIGRQPVGPGCRFDVFTTRTQPNQVAMIQV
jgi:hypothetical protein